MPPPYPPGTNSLPPGGTLIINQTPIIGGTDTYILYDNNGVVGVEPASSLGLTVGVTPISGGTAGYVLSDNGGTLEEVPASSLSFAFYVNGSTGSDTNTGLSPGAAWQTISKVNASTFSPGAAILFAGGQTFSGAIVSPNAGTAAQPITFGSYGGGQATISSGTSNGFTSTNQAGIIVRDLTFTGTASTNIGIHFNNTLGSNVHLQNIQVINCNVSGYGWSGIHVDGNNGSAGYDDVLIEGCSADSCCGVAQGLANIGTSGIQVGSNTGYGLAVNAPSFINVTIRKCRSTNNTGSTDTNWSGSGILVGGTNGCLIDDCDASGNGTLAVNVTGGPIGIWAADAINVLIRTCRSINNSSGNTLDGSGFGFDAGTKNGVIEGCYSKGNFGCGYFLEGYSDGFVTANDSCSVINCISENDGGGSGATNNASFVINNTGVLTNLRILNCVAIQSNASTHVVFIKGSTQNSITGVIDGNTFIVSGTQEFVYTTGAPAITFAGNNYKCSPGNFFISWNGTTYTSLLAFYLGAGKELTNTTNLSRLVLSGNTSFFITTAGNDTTGNGTLAAPWLTLQHAVNWIASYVDFAGFIVTINIGTGTFAGCYLTSFEGGGSLVIAGNGNTNTILQGIVFGLPYSVGAVLNILVPTNNQVFVHDLEIDVTTIHSGSNAGINVQGYNQVFLTDPTNNAGIAFNLKAGAYCIGTTSASIVDAEGFNPATITLNGTAAAGFVESFGASEMQFGDTIAMPNTPAWSVAFVSVADLTDSQWYGAFSGTATGPRFLADNSTVNTFGSGLTFLPGNAAGTVKNGGVYA